MRVAQDPRNGDEIDVPAYVARFGHRVDPKAPDDRPKALCPACGRDLIVVAEAMFDRTAHFRHDGAAGDCPLVAIGRAPYLGLPDIAPNPGQAQVLKASFRANWFRHHALLDGRVGGAIPYLSVDEFIDLLSEADRRRIWELRGLQECNIPYLMLSFFDYRPDIQVEADARSGRRLWFRFAFRTIGPDRELWIRGPGTITLNRLAFEPPQRRGARPGVRQFIGFRPIAIDADFLTRPLDAPFREVVNRVEGWMRRRWR